MNASHKTTLENYRVDRAKSGYLQRSVNITKWLKGKEIDLAVILGSGLGDYGKDHSDTMEIPYNSVGLPIAGVPGHAGILRYSKIGRHGVLLFSGRKHLYEPFVELDTTLMAVRAAFHAGATTQILTCATGSVNLKYRPGQLVLIKDHINYLGVDPTQPFVAMTNVYDEGLRKDAQCVASRLYGRRLAEGVLTSKRGPSFETPAEIKALRVLGADMAGMSTIHEAMALKELGARVLGISLITNYGAGIVPGDISHEDNSKQGEKAAKRFSHLLTSIIGRLK